MAVIQNYETVLGLPTSATASILDLSSTDQQLQVIECQFMDPRRTYLHVNKLETWHISLTHVTATLHSEELQALSFQMSYRQTSNISHILVGDKIVNHTYVIGAWPVGAAPSKSSFST